MSFGLKTETPAASRRDFRSFNLYSKTEVIFVGNLLYGLIALASAAGAIFFLFIKEKQEGNLIPLVIGIILVVLTIVFGGLFLAGRVNKTEDIHITE